MTTSEALSELDGKVVLRLSADVVASYLLNNTVSQTDLPALIRAVHESLLDLGSPEPVKAAPERKKPAVPIGKSIQDDYLVCLEDGKRLKMLKRYLRSKYGLSPDDYRRKWSLPADYPMVAPAYANRRSEFAKQIGLGKGVRRATNGKTAKGAGRGRAAG